MSPGAAKYIVEAALASQPRLLPLMNEFVRRAARAHGTIDAAYVLSLIKEGTIALASKEQSTQAHASGPRSVSASSAQTERLVRNAQAGKTTLVYRGRQYMLTLVDGPVPQPATGCKLKKISSEDAHRILTQMSEEDIRRKEQRDALSALVDHLSGSKANAPTVVLFEVQLKPAPQPQAEPAPKESSKAQGTQPKPSESKKVKETVDLYVERKSHDESAIHSAQYRIVLADGSERSGALDASGKAMIADVPKGDALIEYGPDARPFECVAGKKNGRYKPDPMTEAELNAKVDAALA